MMEWHQLKKGKEVYMVFPNSPTWKKVSITNFQQGPHIDSFLELREVCGTSDIFYTWSIGSDYIAGNQAIRNTMSIMHADKRSAIEALRESCNDSCASCIEMKSYNAYLSTKEVYEEVIKDLMES